MPKPSKDVRDALRRTLLEASGSRCFYCGKHVGAGAVTLDHIIPQAQGGPWAFWNLVVACAGCNTERGCMPIDAYFATLRARAEQAAELAALVERYEASRPKAFAALAVLKAG